MIAGLKEPYGLANLVEKGFLEKGELYKHTNSSTLTQSDRREIESRREWE